MLVCVCAVALYADFSPWEFFQSDLVSCKYLYLYQYLSAVILFSFGVLILCICIFCLSYLCALALYADLFPWELLQSHRMSRKRLLSVGFLVFHHCCIENLGLRGFVLEKYMQVLNLNKRITDRRSKLLSADLLVGFYEIHTCTLFLVLPLSSYKGQWGSRLAAFIAKVFLYSLQKVFLARHFFPILLRQECSYSEQKGKEVSF